MRDKGRMDYINRPLNDAEREFAAENHDLIYKYMRGKRLDAEEFYDELIIDFLTAVKQYVTEKPELQVKYPFKQVLFQKLNGRMQHYWREYHRGKRTLEREAVRLDYEDEESGGRIEPWWIDPMQNVERYVVEKEFLNDVYSNISRYAEPDLLKLIIDMRKEGWTDFEIAKKAIKTIADYSSWNVKETAQFIRLITRSSHSPLQKLYSDTLYFGNIDQYCEWKDVQRDREWEARQRRR